MIEYKIVKISKIMIFSIQIFIVKFVTVFRGINSID